LEFEFEDMKIKFYGTRGSLPVCEREFQEFGGNTTCVLLTSRNKNIAILDAGTGIRNLGKDLIAKGHEQYENIYIGVEKECRKIFPPAFLAREKMEIEF
jgi:hypothetical protein